MAGASVIWPASALGSTALVRPSERPFIFGQAQELAYSADPGERNDVVVEAAYIGSAWTVRDPGAVIVPGAFCTPVDAHTVRCVSMPSDNPMTGLLWADVSLGDLDDRATQIGPDPSTSFPFYAAGGSGNDRILGTEMGGELRGGPGDDHLTSPTGFARDAVLDGGGGRDELRGGAGNEAFSDGDLDGAGPDVAPGPDLFEGGAGVDTVSYAQRTLPVSVDLAKRSGADRDVARGIESVVGGAGDDRLGGDANANVIDGRGGRDELRGRGGDDQFSNGGGRTSCGTGVDVFFKPRSADILKSDCETVSPHDYPEVSRELPAYPTAVKPRVAVYRFSCGRDPDEGTVDSCSATLTVRKATGKPRQLGSARIPSGPWMNRRVKIRLTPLGRRLASRRNGVQATMRIAIRDRLALRWTIQLTIRRR
jgi:hypothetical protein